MPIGSGYKIKKKIAEGEFSHGYLAEHELLGIEAFVKQARKSDEATHEVFRREAKILGTVSIPGIPALREYCTVEVKPAVGITLGPVRKTPCIIMELIPTGIPCRKLITKDQPYDTRATVWILYRALSILNKLHVRYNTAHCDINPDNLLVDPNDGYGSTNIVDFGLAMSLNGSVAKFWNKTDPVPEFEQGLPVTKAVDYYGVGMLGRFLLTGGSTDHRVWKVCRHDLPHEVHDLINELTHEDPAQRLQDFEAAKKRLEYLGRMLENAR